MVMIKNAIASPDLTGRGNLSRIAFL